MDEDKKDLAKRFFTLLYLFLTRKYGEVDLVFVRHTDDAEEVDEDTFFHDTRSGGTVVFSALDLAEKIRAERYARGWNVYVAQASDGDAFGADPARSSRFLREKLLPATRYSAYLELPNLARTEFGRTEQRTSIRSGFTKSGVPANLAIIRTLRQSLARRIALAGSIARELATLEAEFAIAAAVGHAERAAWLHDELQRLTRRRGQLPFIDEPDLRYRNRVWRPEPIARAAMFCLMDVSASMDEEKKDLAKRFFTLLYLFLTRKYGEVDLVFIRHTDDAEEVDEDTFFHDTRSGGTVVFSALDLAETIRAARYARGWNVYVAQASDGDAFGADPARSARFLREKLLPATRYYAYLELADPRSSDHASSLWAEYERVAEATTNFAMKRASQRDQVYPVFRELFRKEAQA
jgi:uncharacterized sporulation protein YeaH/YhbH (DUF444 family)